MLFSAQTGVPRNLHLDINDFNQHVMEYSFPLLLLLQYKITHNFSNQP